MRREERVTVQGPVKEQQPDGMSQRGFHLTATADTQPTTVVAKPTTGATQPRTTAMYNCGHSAYNSGHSGLQGSRDFGAFGDRLSGSFLRLVTSVTYVAQ